MTHISRLDGCKQWPGPVDYGRLNTGTSASESMIGKHAKLNPGSPGYISQAFCRLTFYVEGLQLSCRRDCYNKANACNSEDEIKLP